MAAEFRCENCGSTISADNRHSSDTIQCPHCRKNVSIPAGLASLPRPHVPPDNEPATQTLEASQDPEDATMVVMANIMPWVVSIFLHTALALIMAFVVMLSGSAAIPDAVTIPTATLDNHISHRILSRTIMKLIANRTENKRPFSMRENEINPGDGITAGQIRLITESGNPLEGLRDRTDTVNFLGVPGGGKIYHIVWVIDRSGSMMDSFEVIKRETATTIGQLKPEQDFHIILFSDGPPMEIKSRRLMPANKKAKLEAVKFLTGAMALDQTDPIPALQRAFAVLKKAGRKHPKKLIYLLTDGVFPDNKAVMDVIQMENPGKEVSINTFLYGKRPPVAVNVLQAIANNNGGVYKWISPDE